MFGGEAAVCASEIATMLGEALQIQERKAAAPVDPLRHCMSEHSGRDRALGHGILESVRQYSRKSRGSAADIPPLHYHALLPAFEQRENGTPFGVAGDRPARRKEKRGDEGTDDSSHGGR